MHRLLVIAFGIALLTTTGFADAGAHNVLTAEEKAAGWKLLFDGEALVGWMALGSEAPPRKGWVARDGTLLLDRGPGGAAAGDIVTAEHFEHFDLTWEWKIGAGGNSGLKYNLLDPKKGVGCEYQLLDDSTNPDAKAHGATRQTGGLYDVLEPPGDKKLHPPGEWNKSRILVRGNHVEHWLNGGKTADFEFGSVELTSAVAQSKFKGMTGWTVKKKSPILLQDHGNTIAFRNIKIRALPEK